MAAGRRGWGQLSARAVRVALQNKTPIALLALVLAAGTMLWKGRRSSRLKARSKADGDVDADACDDDGDAEQGGPILCRVTLGAPSDGAAKALPRWAWGYFLSGGREVQVTPSGKVRYRVRLPSTGRAGWFGADEVEFVDGERFNGHDLRRRV